MLTSDFTLTKAQLGWLLVAAGALSFVGVISVDVIALVQQGGLGGLFSAETIAYLRSPLGIGPAQRLALGACVAVALIGLTLIPLGERPA